MIEGKWLPEESSTQKQRKNKTRVKDKKNNTEKIEKLKKYVIKCCLLCK